MLHYTYNQEKPEEWDTLSFDEKQNYPIYSSKILKVEDYLEKSIYSLESLKENYLLNAKKFSELIGNENIIMQNRVLAETMQLQFLETSYLSDECISKIDSMMEELKFYKESIYNLITENKFLSYACRLVIEEENKYPKKDIKNDGETIYHEEVLTIVQKLKRKLGIKYGK